MMNAQARNETALRGRLRYAEPMSRHSTWRVGGPAERFYEPADVDDLRVFLGTLSAEETLTWVGLGSNLLVRDGGITGTVVMTAGALNDIRHAGEACLEVEAGVSCARLARVAARSGLSGAEFLVGIPGTMGGALAMNAGADGSETWRIVESVRVIDRAGDLRERSAADFTIAYRSVTSTRSEWFVSARLRLIAADPEECLVRIRELLDKRAAAQPIGKPSCGSVFRNPPGDYAGRLIEAAGLKGTREGGCHVSARHANFIINDGNASARDIETLIRRMQDAVRASAGVDLVPEVRIIGRRPGASDDR